MTHLKCIFSVGVCGGIQEKVKLGDVVVSSAIYGYADLKKMPWVWINRSVGKLSKQSGVYNQLSHAKIIYPPNISVKRGPVLSGPWLIADTGVQADLLNLAPEAVAFEMEGANIVEACSPTSVECLVVKGVSDLADMNKADDWQPQAATNAVKFLSSAMEQVKFFFTS